MRKIENYDVDGKPLDKSYLEYELPNFLKESIDKMEQAWADLDKGVPNYTWDCDYCELQSNINVCEIEQLITSEQAWYLREKYLRQERDESV